MIFFNDTVAIFLSPHELSKYERSIQSQLKCVTVISHSLMEDSPGGSLFETVEENLKKAIRYDYIFLNQTHSYGLLKKIFINHSITAREFLTLETANDSFWAFGNYANMTIYEFKNNRASEGYLRMLIEIERGHEVPIYLRTSEAFVDNLWSNIEEYRMQGLIVEYRAGGHHEFTNK